MFTIPRTPGRSESSSRGLPEFANSLIDSAHVSAISKSRERCRAMGLRDTERPDHTPISRADFSISRERSVRLFRHAAPIMEILYEQIVNTHSMVLLTDDQGTILHGIGDNDFLSKAEKVALLPGVNWAENHKGTNGMGTALIDERPTLVHAGEHYLSANHFLTCSSAPIFDPRGDLLGVLDVTSDHRSYHQHTMGLVKMSARMIENDWFNDNFRESLRLYIHPRSEFLGTLMQGILAISRDGRILGANRCAVEMLSMSPAALRMHSISSLLGTSLGVIVDHARQSGSTNIEPLTLSTSNGLVLRTRAELTWAPVLAASSSASLYIEDEKFEVPKSADEVNTKDTKSFVSNHESAALSTPPATAKRNERRGKALATLNTGDPQFANVLEKCSRVLDRKIPILILGETGTGKEWLARAMHDDSGRADRPFVTVNCASIPPDLIEGELFGYEDGAAPGSRKQASIGKMLQAHGGTLFLDEIGDMPLPLQAHLLHVLQERQITPIGGSKAINIDISIICASHADLKSMLEKHNFREDLYYRLNGMAVKLPALRQRTDMHALIRNILKQLLEEEALTHCHELSLSSSVMRLFENYSWPGNIRQLDNVLRTASVMATSDGVIDVAHLPDDFVEEASAASNQSPSMSGRTVNSSNLSSQAQTLEELEIATIRTALDAAYGNISVAAKKLGISRNTIYRKLKWKQTSSPE